MNKKLDLTGQRFGNWHIVEQAENKNGNIMWVCECKCGGKKVLQGSMLRRGESKGCRKCRDTKNVRTRYGRLTVIEDAGYIGASSKLIRCICNCGKEIVVPQSSLVTGNTKSCGCLKMEGLKDRALPGNEIAENGAIHTMKRNAINRKLEWSLTRQEAMSLITKNCYYCNTPPSNVARVGNKIFKYNGLDRTNNKKGYFPDNVCSCCKICNRAKSILTTEEFLDWVARIYKRSIEKPRIKLLEPTITIS